ncbi:Ribonuclease 3 [Botrimarina colliarenosi]|uniref:Ribonuclease 3 n=1 Tax=Botrimarina colliarenosi TaxID=2528001 RepID=A0A5C6A280_9BACT|nr:ribonuclease III [Botrimarina colliarenosi]TWT93397.1 Ribonuclease 3 [Botrimarina colliarenosi]
MSDDPVSDAVDFDACEVALGYRFRDRGLLESALTHASGADHRLGSNERMEFLGDAILGAIVCEQLYDHFPDFLEGDLTKVKSVVVSRQTCAKLSKRLGLQPFLILGKGMTTSPTVPPSVMADVFESLVAAIYLDGGRDAAAEFVMPLTLREIEHAAAEGVGGENFKSLLQQLVQREEGTTPNYCLLDEKGPDHSKVFQVAVQISDRRFTGAWGKTKKEAEQRAAANALAELEGDEPPYLGVEA